MTKTVLIAALLFACLPCLRAHATGMPEPNTTPQAATYSFDSTDILFSDENGYGYRKLTSVKPASGDSLPISNITVYPESDIQGGLDFDYRSEEGPQIQGKSATFIIRGNIPLPP